MSFLAKSPVNHRYAVPTTFFNLAKIAASSRQGDVGKSRRELFKEIERAALKPLPAMPFEYAEWKSAKVHPDYYVEVDKTFYSVPHRLIGCTLQVRLTHRVVEVFHDHQRVARHDPSLPAVRPRQGRWLTAHEGLIITGHTGTGKSWLACAFGRQAARFSHSVLCVRAAHVPGAAAIKHAMFVGFFIKILARPFNFQISERLSTDDPR